MIEFIQQEARAAGGGCLPAVLLLYLDQNVSNLVHRHTGSDGTAALLGRLAT
eukprot:COSAG01_NODE_71665_length_255_cov_0.660256_2_plen_51_part_01